MRKVVREEGLTIQVNQTPEEKLEGASSYCTLIRNSIDFAIRENASDIHFEPTAEGFKIRVRICGLLNLFYSSKNDKNLSISPEILRSAMMTTLKSISNLPLGKQNEAQDSRISFSDRGIDVRVNKVPCEFGEKVVYRLFNKNESKSIDDLGLSSQADKDLKEAVSKKSGLIIITGETGSGKTSTIYTLIQEMDKYGLNISTLENPVERIVEGVTHIQVSKKLSFASGLKALLRQDPDVILVGEIRDEETAQLAVRAASTGHLVISTMHTNTALDVPKVFEYYGADKYQLMRSLILSANQRLIRKICPKCSTKSKVKIKGNFRTANPKGCDACYGGYLNERVLIFEYFNREGLTEAGEIQLKQSIDDEVFNLAKKGEINEDEIIKHAI